MKKIILIIGCIGAFCGAYTQTLQTPCATTAQNNVGNMVISYTIGEVVLVSSFKSNGLLITQGIIQPVIDSKRIYNNGFATGELTLFPVPVSNLLNVQINILKVGKMQLRLYNSVGQIVIKDEIKVNSFITPKYNLSSYGAGTYYLHLDYLSSDGQSVKKSTFKIIKL